jgi:hypothetical protein
VDKPKGRQDTAPRMQGAGLWGKGGGAAQPGPRDRSYSLGAAGAYARGPFVLDEGH